MAKQKSSQLDLIKNVLHDKYLQKDSDAKVLIEKDKNNTLMKRDIIAYGMDYLLYRYDPNEVELFPYFENQSGLKKICDYILFVEEKHNLFCLLIELKLGTESSRNQLIASECFVEFIISSAKRIGVGLTDNIKCIKIRISEERANRRKSQKQTTKNSSLEYDVNNIINYDYITDFRIQQILDI